MHPVVLILPAAVLSIGPHLWARQVLRRYGRVDTGKPDTASEVARALLDERGLQFVKVEPTDIGDHYDPTSSSVRIHRDRFDSTSLAAITTAAHEVGHARQHADHYAPFVWRGGLVRIASIVGVAGYAVLLAVPVAALAGRRPVPPALVGTAVWSLIGTGLAVQLVALPTELDASFNKAIRMLQDGHIQYEQLGKAKKILLACSMTYVAAPLTSILTGWTWLPRASLHAGGGVNATGLGPRRRPGPARVRFRAGRGATPGPSTPRRLFRSIAKPLIRQWMLIAGRPRTAFTPAGERQ